MPSFIYTALLAITSSSSVINAHVKPDLQSCGITAPNHGVDILSQEISDVELPRSLAQEDIVINTYFHLVATSKDDKDGYISREAVAEQMKQLNTDFNGSGISFRLQNVTWTVNQEWAMHKGKDYNIEMKRKLRQGRYGDLNLYYVTKIDWAGAYCFYPTSPPPKDLAGDGCVMNIYTLPGRSKYYGLGKATAHEVGHWLFLYHPFEGGCEQPGDYVDDTAPSNKSLRDCPEGTDTCPNQPGLDDIHNHMQGTSDECRTEFTRGQIERMKKVWHQLRKGK